MAPASSSADNPALAGPDPTCLVTAGLLEASQAFQRTPGEFIDFRFGVNVLQPPVPEGAWDRWRGLASCHADEDGTLPSQRIADVLGIDPRQIVATRSAGEALHLVAGLLRSMRVLLVEPGPASWRRTLAAGGAIAVPTVLRRDAWSDPIEFDGDLLKSVDAVLVGNPSEPFGALHPKAHLTELLRGARPDGQLWVVDESQILFAGPAAVHSMVSELRRIPNLIIIGSFSEACRIPGIGAAYIAVANPSIADDLRARRIPGSLGAFSQAWILECLTRAEFARLQSSLLAFGSTRDRWATALRRVPGLKVFSSHSASLLLEISDPRISAPRVIEHLGRQGLLVNGVNGYVGIDPLRFVRVAVRTEAENRLLINGLTSAMVMLPLGAY